DRARAAPPAAARAAGRDHRALVRSGRADLVELLARWSERSARNAAGRQRAHRVNRASHRRSACRRWQPHRNAQRHPNHAPPPVAAGAASARYELHVRLLYEPDVFLLLNISDEPIDVSDLVFEQTGADGSVRSFEAAEWDRYISTSSAYLEEESCLQLLTGSAPPPEPDEDNCPRLAGFFRSNVERRYFWRSDNADESFTVRLGEVTLATCAIGDGTCSFSLPAP